MPPGHPLKLSKDELVEPAGRGAGARRSIQPCQAAPAPGALAGEPGARSQIQGEIGLGPTAATDSWLGLSGSGSPAACAAPRPVSRVPGTALRRCRLRAGSAPSVIRSRLG